MEAPITAIRPCVVLLNGFPGTGKLITARILQSLLPRKSVRLLDNHLWIDPALAIEPKLHSAACIHLQSTIRNQFFDHLKEIEDKDASIIITNVLSTEEESDISAFKKHVEIADARHVPFVLVSLTCDAEENKRRVAERDPGSKKKLRDPAVVEEMIRKHSLLDPESDAVVWAVEGVDFNRLEIDTTGLKPEESAEKILKFLRKLD